MAVVKAKFRCNGVNLARASKPNPQVLEAVKDDYSHHKFIDKADELGLPAYVEYDQPTVVLNPVYAGQDASEEDKAFWDATPNGKLEMCITNHRAAETFELGKDYYLTFEPAD